MVSTRRNQAAAADPEGTPASRKKAIKAKVESEIDTDEVTNIDKDKRASSKTNKTPTKASKPKTTKTPTKASKPKTTKTPTKASKPESTKTPSKASKSESTKAPSKASKSETAKTPSKRSKAKLTATETASATRSTRGASTKLEKSKKPAGKPEKSAANADENDDHDGQDEDSDAPAEISSKGSQGIKSAALAMAATATDDEQAAQKKKNRKERKLLDPAILDVVSTESKAQSVMTDIAMPSYPEFRGKKKKFSDDSDNEDEVDIKQDVQTKRFKASSDERDVLTGLKVKALTHNQTLARSVPASVSNFLRDHLYGTRVKRAAKGNRSRHRSNKFRPAKSFVVSN